LRAFFLLFFLSTRLCTDSLLPHNSPDAPTDRWTSQQRRKGVVSRITSAGGAATRRSGRFCRVRLAELPLRASLFPFLSLSISPSFFHVPLLTLLPPCLQRYRRNQCRFFERRPQPPLLPRRHRLDRRCSRRWSFRTQVERRKKYSEPMDSTLRSSFSTFLLLSHIAFSLHFAIYLDHFSLLVASGRSSLRREERTAKQRTKRRERASNVELRLLVPSSPLVTTAAASAHLATLRQHTTAQSSPFPKPA
jgi:hypothetical protein